MKIIRICNTERTLYCKIGYCKMFLIKSFLKGALYDCSRHSCLKLMIQAHLHAGSFKLCFTKHNWLLLIYLRNETIMKCFTIKKFCMDFFTTLKPKIIIETLRSVTIESPGRIYCSTFLFDIILYFSLRKYFFWYSFPS